MSARRRSRGRRHERTFPPGSVRFAVLPLRMAQPGDEPRRAAPLDPDEMRRMCTDAFRLQGEIDRQTERFGSLWAAQAHHVAESYAGLILAMLIPAAEDES
jgi:hypothetical protein